MPRPEQNYQTTDSPTDYAVRKKLIIKKVLKCCLLLFQFDNYFVEVKSSIGVRLDLEFLHVNVIHKRRAYEHS